MSNARKQRESAFHDKIFGAGDDPRRAIAKYYKVSDSTHTLYRTIVSGLCRGKRLLEYGCGTGVDSLFWAASGARVTGIDISNEAIRQARDSAARAGARIDYAVMDAEALRFEDSSFDVVVGNGILHHLSPQTTYAELSRILKPDGHAIFIEPMGHNPLINLYRKCTPSMRSEDEHPLLMADLRLAGQYFHDVDARFFNLFTLLAVPFRKLRGFGVLLHGVRMIDAVLFSLLPFTKKYAWMVILHVSQPGKAPRAALDPPRGRPELPARHRLREVDPAQRQDVAAITRLHLALLGHGPMARLGELFLRQFCYTVLLRDGLMRAALFEVDGRPAGFVAYTDRSITFHRHAIRRRAAYVAWLIALSVFRDPRLMPRLLKAVRLMVSRRAELNLGQDPLGEVLAIGVLPEYRTPQFVRGTGLRIGEELVAHVADYLGRAGVTRMRMVVEAHNKPALVFYHGLGGRFEPYEHAGEPMVQVWFDLAPGPHADEAAAAPRTRTSDS